MKKKQKIKDKLISYTVKNNNEVEVCGLITEKTLKMLEIPEKVNLDNKTSYKVTSIGIKAFENCKLISSIIIPSSIITIKEHAFSNCNKLKSITFNEGLKHIKEFAFDGCSTIKEMIIPSSVEIIEDKAFANCKKLESMSLGLKTRAIADNAFENSDNIIFDIRSQSKNVTVAKRNKKPRKV